MSQIVREIVERIEQLPEAERAELDAEMSRRPRPRATPFGVPASQLIGIAAGNGPPPDDETIRRWIDEHRTEKYG